LKGIGLKTEIKRGRFMKVKIWGARGSVPSPLGPAVVREKIISAMLRIAQLEDGELRAELISAILERASR
jgi:hypothetical protein